MPHETRQRSSNMSRRSALGGVGAAAAALGLGTVSRVAAQDVASERAAHPIVGAWVTMNPGNPPNASPGIFAADGTMTYAFVPNYIDPNLGLVFQGVGIGVWEPDGARGVRLTLVQALSAPDGTYLGTFTLDAYPVVSEDGQSFLDDGKKVHFTIRDANNVITLEMGAAGGEVATPEVHARRMHVGNPGLPEAASAASTPTG
jgi:hypothetical protein